MLCRNSFGTIRSCVYDNDGLMLGISATDQISNLFLYFGMVDYHQEQLQPQLKSGLCSAVDSVCCLRSESILSAAKRT